MSLKAVELKSNQKFWLIGAGDLTSRESQVLQF